MVYLTIRCIAGSCDHLMKIIPVNNLMIWNAPYANFCIQRATDEVIVIHRIKLDASHCVNRKQKPDERKTYVT